jgi:hypothetical protein
MQVGIFLFFKKRIICHSHLPPHPFIYHRWETAANITATWGKIGIKPDIPCNVRDLWAHSQNGVSLLPFLFLFYFMVFFTHRFGMLLELFFFLPAGTSQLFFFFFFFVICENAAIKLVAPKNKLKTIVIASFWCIEAN